MSFTQSVKKEILSQKIQRKDEALAILLGYSYTKGTVLPHEITLSVDDTIKNYFLKYHLPDEYEVSISKNTIIIQSPYNYFNFLDNSDLLEKKAFLRGNFLGTGSVNDPFSKYHLEITYKDEYSLNLALATFNELNIDASVYLKDIYKIYLKDSHSISDALVIFGAKNMTLKFENAYIVKSKRNDTNRIVNCETANLERTISAAVKQVEAIEELKKRNKLELLPETLYNTAILRLINPHLTLNELVKLSGENITKSGLNHRLNKIVNIYKDLKSKE